MDELSERAERHRRELHVHCYRMLGSFEEAEDAVQETMVRAWRARQRFGSAGDNLRAWLYRIATNTCLDVLKSKGRRITTMSSFAEVPWLQPYPDRLLDELADPSQGPDAVVVARETIELAYLAVIQLLPPRQRAVLLLRDVLEWSAAETAEALELSVAAANSALQRARATVAAHAADRDAAAPGAPTDEEHALLRAFIATHESGDIERSLALLRDDIRVTMPPHPYLYEGRDAIAGLMAEAHTSGAFEAWRLVPAWANRQPAAISYARLPGDSALRAFKVDVLRVRDGRIAEITTFDARLCGAFGMPEVLEA
ncbi:MAG: RNA polymerase subunit sigma-70 [Solirubrobacteraceae bacterium]